jgi:hypothetical protein
MRSLQSARCQPDIRAISLRLPSMLHEAGDLDAPQQGGCCRNAGSDCQIQGRAWTGADFGVRPPDPDETPLSIDECWVAVREGLI